jgi:hypothetical protein
VTKCIFINSKERTITEVPDNSYPKLSEMVEGSIELAMQFPNDDVLYVNEEGMLIGLDYWFIFEGGHQPFAGNGVLCGADRNDGDNEGEQTYPPSFSVDDVRTRVRFPTIEQVRAWARANASDPAVSIRGPGGPTTIVATTGDLWGVSPSKKKP